MVARTQAQQAGPGNGHGGSYGSKTAPASITVIPDTVERSKASPRGNK